MNSTSISADSSQSFFDQLDQASNEGFSPNLCIAFCDAEFDYPEIVKALSDKNIDLIGATTCGELHNDKTVVKSFTALLMDLPKESYEIVLKPNNGSVFQSAADIGSQAMQRFEKPAVLLYAAGNSVNGELRMMVMLQLFSTQIKLR